MELDENLLNKPNKENKNSELEEKTRRVKELLEKQGNKNVIFPPNLENKLKELGLYDEIIQNVNQNSMNQIDENVSISKDVLSGTSDKSEKNDKVLDRNVSTTKTTTTTTTTLKPPIKTNIHNDSLNVSIKNPSDMTLRILYATKGRFSIPDTIRWRDYNVKEITNLSMVNEDTFLDVLVDVLNEMNYENVNVDDMILWELYQTLIELKKNFISTNHTHYWFCTCQNDKENKQPSQYDIDLDIVKYKYIEEYDEEIRKEWKHTLEYLTEEEKKEILNGKSEEEFINQLSLKEPMKFNFENGIKIVANFVRVKDLKEAILESLKRYKPKIASIESQMYKYSKSGNVNKLLELKKQKEDLDKERSLFVMLYSRAKSIIDVKLPDEDFNYSELDIDKKIEILEMIPRNILFYVGNYIDGITFFQDIEVEVECNQCGKKNTKKFPADFTLLEFLPYSRDEDIPPENRPKIHRNVKVLFGV